VYVNNPCCIHQKSTADQTVCIWYCKRTVRNFIVLFIILCKLYQLNDVFRDRLPLINTHLLHMYFKDCSCNYLKILLEYSSWFCCNCGWTMQLPQLSILCPDILFANYTGNISQGSLGFVALRHVNACILLVTSGGHHRYQWQASVFDVFTYCTLWNTVPRFWEQLSMCELLWTHYPNTRSIVAASLVFVCRN